MKHITLLAGTLLALATSAAAQWSDNFDSYATGTSLDNVGGWFGWDNVAAVAGTVDSTVSRSGSNSVFCTSGSDPVHPNLGITSGKWAVTAWQYIPAASVGDLYFILNNVYNHGGPYLWSTELHCTGGVVIDDLRPFSSQPLVVDQWVEFRANIDLDANTVAYYYNGALVSQGIYAVQGGPIAIDNIDLFSGGGTCYWDDIVLERREAPHDLVAFDADGDGRLDLAAANFLSNDVSLYLNSGTGTFNPDIHVAVTLLDTGVTALAAGDLDGDAAADDLAVACSTSNTVCTILNPNALVPTLTSLSIPLIANPVDVAVANLDGPGPSDIVVACAGSMIGTGGIAVSLNGGPFAIIALGSYVKLAVADLDGDGDNDIAAVAHGTPDSVDLFENHGSGVFTFAGSILLTTTGTASGLSASDMDGVGGIDLVALIPDPVAPNNAFNIHKNTGAGALGPARFTTVGPISTPGMLASDVACGDFEQDSIVGGPTVFLSRKDLCIVNGDGSSPISHHGFNGTTFLSTQVHPAGINPIACVVADFNGDGQDDLAIANQDSDDITVALSPPLALAPTFGTGCPGTGGLIPIIGHSGGLPVSGSATFAVTLAQAKSLSLAGLLISFTAADTPLGSCRIYVGAPVATSAFVLSDSVGNASKPFPIPASPVFLGADAYLQWAVFDPSGAYSGILAFSPGLRIQIGP